MNCQPLSIGIWKRKVEKNEVIYERDPDRTDEWPHWSDTQKFCRKKLHKRIVLLGESVARGYLYDPYYNVAMELEAIINELFRAPYCEVVDLAKNSITMEALLDLAQESTDLDPDAVVIFAGNNWLHALRDTLGSEDYKKMFERFKKDSFAGVKEFLEKKFERVVLSFLHSIQDIFIRRQIPVVLLIPGYNLKDWKSDSAGKSLAWLPGDSNIQWLEAKKVAADALLNKHFDELEKAGEKMIDLDPFNPLGYELLSEAYIFHNKKELALECLESCRDAVLISRGGNEHPRSFGIIRSTIVEQAGTFGIKVVDLPGVFNEFMKDGIPDRTLYLDYCHLTVKGIKVSMRHAAAMVIPLLSGQEIPLDQIPASSLYPAKEALAATHFCAAIHNAHSGQPRNILDYHCRQSLAYSENISTAMLQYVDFTNRYAATALCRSFQDIMTGGKIKQYTAGFALGSFDRGKLLDLELVDSMAEAMEATGMNGTIKRVKQLRQEEHCVGEEKVNLLASYYSLNSLRELHIDPRPVYFQARAEESVFSFITDAVSALRFDLVYRTPNRFEADLLIDIALNDEGNVIQQIPMSKKWLICSIDVPAANLLDGVNKLFIRWPYTVEPLNESTPVTSAARFLSVTIPVLGEIHSLAVAVNKQKHDKCSPDCPNRVVCTKKLQQL